MEINMADPGMATPLEAAERRLACGVDIVELAPFARVMAVGGEPFLRAIYTDRERAYCRERVAQLAARFAAKEAVAKALGTGIRGIDWTEMEVASEPTGCPHLVLSGQAAARTAQRGLAYWAVSLSHSETYAMAFVVALAL